MKRWLLLAVLLVTLIPTPARATFRLFRRSAARPVEVSYSWYLPPPLVWTPVAQPVSVSMFAAPVYEVTSFVPLTYPVAAPPPLMFEPPLVQPIQPVEIAPRAVEPPLATPSPAPASGTIAAQKPGTSFYDLYSGSSQTGAALGRDRCSVAFWNLTGGTVRMRIAGQERAFPPGRTVTMELPRVFAWQVIGREAEAARIPADHSTVEILIRR